MSIYFGSINHIQKKIEKISDGQNIHNLCWEFEKMDGDSHYFFVLAKTGLIFCKILKVFFGVG
jgi:hypothetical protein